MLFAETARKLSGACARELGWPPDTFWNATPAELVAIADAGTPPGVPTLARSELEMMMERERDG